MSQMMADSGLWRICCTWSKLQSAQVPVSLELIVNPFKILFYVCPWILPYWNRFASWCFRGWKAEWWAIRCAISWENCHLLVLHLLLLACYSTPMIPFSLLFVFSWSRMSVLNVWNKRPLHPKIGHFSLKDERRRPILDLHSRQSTMTVDEELASGRDFYGVLLHLLEQLIEGEIESGLFEEKVRYMFGTSGYLIFTFDKVLLSLLRQTLAVLNDASCENLIDCTIHGVAARARVPVSILPVWLLKTLWMILPVPRVA